MHDLQAERAKRTDGAKSPPGGDACDRNRGLASQPPPYGRTAPARLPAATCAARPYDAHARPTSDAEQSLHTGLASRLAHPRKISEKNKQTPGDWGGSGRKFRSAGGNHVLGASGACEGLPADGAELGGAARGCGVGGPGPGRGLPGGPTASLCPGRVARDSEGRPHVGQRSGGRARARPMPRRAPGRPLLELAGTGPVFDAPRYLTGAYWTAPVMSTGVRRARKRPCRAQDRQDCGRGTPRAALKSVKSALHFLHLVATDF